ncbi:efflux RND transporter periplasmic adaptor subunit [bacterium]|nr:efflux RND transporter periplasmic adaptor subunit [bacterium]
MKKVVTIVLILAAAAGGVYAFVRWIQLANTESYEIPVMSATNVTIIAQIEETGVIQPRNKVIIKSEVNGRVDALYANDGDVVTAGFILIELDRKDLLNRRRELELERREAMLNLENADLDFKRNSELFEQKLVSADVYDRMRIQLDLRKNSVAKIDSQIATVDDNLKKSIIASPLRGTVLNRAIEVGEVVIGASSVSSGTEIMQVAELDTLEVRSRVNEIDVSSLRTNMSVLISVDSLPGIVFTGSIEHIAPAAGTDQQASATRRAADATPAIQGFEVRVLLSASGHTLKPGMMANLRIPLQSATNTLALPLAAVFCQDIEAAPMAQSFYVFVDQQTNFDKRTVCVGIQNSEFVQITSGLTANTTVALERPSPDGTRRRHERWGRGHHN